MDPASLMYEREHCASHADLQNAKLRECAVCFFVVGVYVLVRILWFAAEAELSPKKTKPEPKTRPESLEDIAYVSVIMYV
jgi:hypothetical protein